MCPEMENLDVAWTEFVTTVSETGDPDVNNLDALGLPSCACHARLSGCRGNSCWRQPETQMCGKKLLEVTSTCAVQEQRADESTQS